MLSSVALPDSFGAALRYLRKRARLTQEELGRAVGYSREQIARLENGSRLPDLAVIAALFVPALMLERDRQLVEQFLSLAGQTRQSRAVTVTRTKATRIQVVQETIAIPDRPTHVPPAPLLPLLGRQTEVADLLVRLQKDRLLTLIGAPGVGKTRLALELANVALANVTADRFADGVVFVSLAEVGGIDDIPYATLAALNVTPAPQQSPSDAIGSYLAPLRLLLVMDNCEHVVEGATLFADWLARAPGLTLLCTSRVALDLYGEQEWPLAPLAVPDLAELPDPDQWARYPAMELLVARARAIDPTFRITDDNLLALATLCVALDGLPLALELAAVRLRDLSPATLVQQLLLLRGQAHLSSTWLQQSRRNVAERHRTLQAAIRWSVGLLSPGTQSAFHRLGVFVGGSTPETAQAVTTADSVELARLARSNLIRIDNGRIQLLETLRSFALEELAVTGGLDDARKAHAQVFTEFAREVFDGLRGDEQAEWMKRALADHDNCLAALRWALAESDGNTAVAIAGGLWWFWTRRGYFALGRELLTAALQLPSSIVLDRAVALNGLAAFCLTDEDYAANLACHEEGLDLRRQLGEPAGIATVLHNMGLTALVMGDYDRALALLAESIAVNPEGDRTSAWCHMGLIAQEMQDLPQARHWLQLAYDHVMSTPGSWLRAFVMNYLADVLREQEGFEMATQLAEESLRQFILMDDSYYLPDAQMTLAQIALDQGDYATAAALLDLAHQQYESREDTIMIATALLVQADLAWKTGRCEEAADMLARSSALRQTVSRVVSPREQAQYDKLEGLLAANESVREANTPRSDCR